VGEASARKAEEDAWAAVERVRREGGCVCVCQREGGVSGGAMREERVKMEEERAKMEEDRTTMEDERAKLEQENVKMEEERVAGAKVRAAP